MGPAFKELSLRSESQKYRGYDEEMISKQNNKFHDDLDIW